MDRPLRLRLRQKLPKFVVYGTERGSQSGSDESRVMSEKVQQLASSIYKEFEMMIHKCGEDVVKDLMPLVVNVLESLDLSYLEKEENQVEMELLREDNEQLVTQYEREKQLRKGQDQKCMEIEDAMESETKSLQDKIESLESIMRMLELKAKNSSDHANRLEEREAEQKTEYSRLHERYTELFKTHIDYMERTKYLMGSDKFDMMQSMPLPAPEMRAKIGLATSVEGTTAVRGISDLTNTAMTQSLPLTAEQTLANQIVEEDWQDEFGETGADLLQSPRGGDTAQTKVGSKQIKTSESEKQGKKDESAAEDVLGADLTGGIVDPAEFASAGMGREVENLIKENTELLETKNALNIVKNDLIARVDELSSEQEILREEIRSLEMVRTKMAEKVKELETELKMLREELNEARRAAEEEGDVPLAQKKRFTRVEMARVLMERNQYKEKLMELQEAVRWTEMVRAKKSADTRNPKKRAGIWDFFSSLFIASEPVPRSSVRYGSAGNSDSPTKRKSQKKTVDFLDKDYSSEKRCAERKEQYRLVKAHVKKDEEGRLQAYGWSIPARDSAPHTAHVPVPVFSRPLVDQQPNLKIWCGCGMVLRGGKTSDGVYIGSQSLFCPKTNNSQEIEKSEYGEAEMAEWQSSSLIWVCSSAYGHSKVTVLDANNPNQVFDAFTACSSHVLCVSAIPGIEETDYPSEDKTKLFELCREGGYLDKSKQIIKDENDLGKVEWIELVQTDGTDDIPTFVSPDQQMSSPTTRHSTNEGTADASLNVISEIGYYLLI